MSGGQDKLTASHLLVDLQCKLDAQDLPEQAQFQVWADLAYQSTGRNSAEMSLCIVDEEEITYLNEQYRGKCKPTNVLSFPFTDTDSIMNEAIAELSLNLLGDIVLCWPVMQREAMEQNKAIHDHAAHMVIHGVLHLCGYDHETDQQAIEMESLETKLLDSLGISNPYH